MMQPHQDSGRPNQSNTNFSTRRVSDWQDEKQRADDQIAPSRVAASVVELQRWALLTAGMPQQPTLRLKSRLIEDEMRERIQRRYGRPSQHRAAAFQPVPTRAPHDDRNRIVIRLADDTFPPLAQSQPGSLKRPHLLSPAKYTSRSGLSAVSYVQSIKRRRSRSPSRKTSAYAAIRRKH
jgi:hypothetical protein